MCKPAYIFSNEKGEECVKCSESISTGCMICDIKNPSSCLFCASNYYMDKQGACVVKIEDKTEVTLQNISILKKMMILLIPLLIWW